MSFQATSKQQAYFRSLTGEYLPRGTGKSKASAMIKKALAGEITRKPDVVTVYGWRFDAVTLRHMTPEMQIVKYAVDQNYRQVNGNFATLTEAEEFARARFPNAQIEVRQGIREQYMD